MGLPDTLIDVHLVAKGRNIHDELEREEMQMKNPKYIIVVDQGSRPGPPIIDSKEARSLIIDHHLSDEFPEDSVVINTSCILGMVNRSPGCLRLSLPASGNFSTLDIRDLQDSAS